ncbi:arabinan endo-1,5-alpha-L-arabinosidase [Neobacillus niacini]|uniref:arabinan endo-1,5-alpha-L-arabinosidase n=1 Tax=Neobacillus driksii TaxID=3035913 RepID=UPI00278218BD|nr:arabinan endo-1,5-alpha-L-arabinosidase [Neobacillus niacini]MDQ0973869.1 arabinan endo-1,5-alpha-L-arabinosidase [Neobacillus niacini]
MKLKTKKYLAGIVILIVLIIGVTLVMTFAMPKTGNLSGITLPAAPADKPVQNINSDILYKEKDWTTNFTHDASIIKADGWYYAFSTDYMVGAPPKPGIQIRKSKDLIKWEFVGRVFEQVSQEAWEWTKGTTFWAPDVVKLNDKYYLYYSVSSVGKRNSYIGVAVSDNIEGPWKDEGAVFISQEGDEHTVNAIDPDIVLDEHGQAWMVYGSYFGGIFITKVDSATGKLVDPNDEGTLMAQRKNMNYGIEGPEIIYNGDTGYYYLTVSYEWLEDTYNVRTARSKNITGPYVDYNGSEMIDTTDESFNTGNKLVGAYRFENSDGWLGTGHNALFEENGEYYLTHNARAGKDVYWSHLHVRKIVWTEDGWPVVSPERYAGEAEQQINEENIIGKWEQIILPRYDDSLQVSHNLQLKSNGEIGEDDKSHWALTGDNTLELTVYDPGRASDDYWKYKLKVIPAWDWENWNGTLVFTGMDQEGTVLWGKKTVEKNK